MKQEHKEWVEENMLLLTTSRKYQPGELEKIFEIYNAITGENKKVTGCARCVQTTKNRIISEYAKA